MTTQTLCSPSTPTQSAAVRPAVAPRIDVVDAKDAYVVYADVPGVAPDAIELKYEGRVLRLRARRAERELPGTAILCETRDADYALNLTLPRDVDTTAISAELEHGVLHVRLPKAAEAVARRIDVTAGTPGR